MSFEANIHPVQVAILRELLFKPEAGFAELQRVVAIDSDHFKFHTNRLVEFGYILKQPNKKYSLTAKGKEYANKLDTDQNVIERQPKCAVMLMVQNDKGELLVQERLKHPYFGYKGYPTGKIRWGETIMEAAYRELDEETELKADFEHKGVYHEHVRLEGESEISEDKIFHVMFGKNPRGKMKETFDGGKNQWMTYDNLKNVDKRFSSWEIYTAIGFGTGRSFEEASFVYSKQEF